MCFKKRGRLRNATAIKTKLSRQMASLSKKISKGLETNKRSIAGNILRKAILYTVSCLYIGGGGSYYCLDRTGLINRRNKRFLS